MYSIISRLGLFRAIGKQWDDFSADAPSRIGWFGFLFDGTLGHFLFFFVACGVEEGRSCGLGKVGGWLGGRVGKRKGKGKAAGKY